MKILYLGPYRQTNDIGIQSKLYLETLSRLGQVYTQPIYLQMTGIDSNTQYISENIDTKDFDILIQHLPIDELAVSKKIHKNICIPIIDNQVLNEHQINKLSFFDRVLVDNIYLYKNIITKKNIKHSLIRTEINFDLHTNRFDLITHNFTKKFYYISDFQNNIELIDDLCTSFLTLSKEYQNITLLLFLYDTDNNNVQAISNTIKDKYKLFQIKNQIINIVPIPINNDIPSLILAHNTGDMYLDISDTAQMPINYNIAKLLNKQIFTIDNVDLKFSLIRNNRYSNNGYFYLNKDDIYHGMKNLLANNSNNNTYKKFNLLTKNTLQ